MHFSLEWLIKPINHARCLEFTFMHLKPPPYFVNWVIPSNDFFVFTNKPWTAGYIFGHLAHQDPHFDNIISWTFGGIERSFVSGERGGDVIFHMFVFEGNRDIRLFAKKSPKSIKGPLSLCEKCKGIGVSLRHSKNLQVAVNTEYPCETLSRRSRVLKDPQKRVQK